MLSVGDRTCQCDNLSMFEYNCYGYNIIVNVCVSACMCSVTPQRYNHVVCGHPDTADKKMIRAATQHWSDKTCITFVEAARKASVSEQHIMFTAANSG